MRREREEGGMGQREPGGEKIGQGERREGESEGG